MLQSSFPAACSGGGVVSVGGQAVDTEQALANLFDIVGELEDLMMRMEACHLRAIELAAAPYSISSDSGGGGNGGGGGVNSSLAPVEARAAASVTRLALERAQHGGLGYAAVDVAQWLGVRVAMYQDDFELKSAALANVTAAMTAAEPSGGEDAGSAAVPGALLALLIAWEASPHIDVACEADIVARMRLAEEVEAEASSEVPADANLG